MGKGKNLIAGLLLALTIPTTVAGVTFTIQNPSIVKSWINGEQVTSSTEDQKEIEELKAEIAMYKEMLAEAEGDKDKIASLEAQIEEHKATISNLEKQLEEAQGNEALIEDLQQQINQQETTISELQSQLESAQEDKALITQLQQKITELENKVAELEEQLQNQGSQENKEITDFTFENGKIISYSGEETDVVVPRSYSIVDGKAVVGDDILVTSIADDAFKKSSITSIDLSNTSIQNLDTYCFYQCPSLQRVNLSNTSIKELPQYCFAECPKLEEVILPNTIEKMGYGVFSKSSSLININLEDTKIKDIGNKCFSDCSSLTDIVLPTTITTIGEESFYGCSSLESVDFSNANLLDSIGQSAFVKCIKLKSIDLTNTKLSTLQGFTFKECIGLVSIIFPETLLSIEAQCFYYTGLGAGNREIVLPASLTNIGSLAFSQTSIKNIKINNFDIYNLLISTSSCGGIISQANVVKVLSSVDNGENEYLSNTSNFTKTVEGDYNVYTKVSV